MEEKRIELLLGVKSDPITYRYSFAWLFDLMAEEGVTYLQLGTFFELYFLPDSYFLRLRREAEERGITISSVFSAYRELGGFLSGDPDLIQVTERNYRRLIEIAALLGASSCGASMGAFPRDRLATREQGIARYLEKIKELLHYAKSCGLTWLTAEPMSCFAEPPCSSEEVRRIGEELTLYWQEHETSAARFGFCADVSHGWIDRDGNLREHHLSLFVATFPYLHEFHWKNTDAMYHETFGFEPENVSRGIVNVQEIRSLLVQHSHVLPEKCLVGYLELPGPKLGRDYSDYLLERMLRESLRYLKRALSEETMPALTE
ncbi:MAG: TIM barrel protein [Atribacterota bacterium]